MNTIVFYIDTILDKKRVFPVLTFVPEYSSYFSPVIKKQVPALSKNLSTGDLQGCAIEQHYKDNKKFDRGKIRKGCEYYKSEHLEVDARGPIVKNNRLF
jgi:hypothetical protein